MYEVDHGLLSTDDIKIILNEVLNIESPITAILLMIFNIIFINNNYYFILIRIKPKIYNRSNYRFLRCISIYNKKSETNRIYYIRR